MNPLDRYETLSFDCYGTLIDWETGIVQAMQPILMDHGIEAPDAEILGLFSRAETRIQSPPYKSYREVLRQVANAFAEEWGVGFESSEVERFAASVPDWPAFPDSASGLASLAAHYDLVILSNVDDDLFAGSAAKLGVQFADVITAEQVGSYKPDPRNFQVLMQRISKPSSTILHVAQSRFHDIAPARQAGLSTVWVNRRAGKQGEGATPPQDATPDLEVHSLTELAALVETAFKS